MDQGQRRRPIALDVVVAFDVSSCAPGRARCRYRALIGNIATARFRSVFRLNWFRWALSGIHKADVTSLQASRRTRLPSAAAATFVELFVSVYSRFRCCTGLIFRAISVICALVGRSMLLKGFRGAQRGIMLTILSATLALAEARPRFHQFGLNFFTRDNPD